MITKNTAEPKPFQTYKVSGVPWLGEIPEHWNVQRGKQLLKKMERPVSEDDEVITCFRDGEVTLRRNRRTEGFTESLQEIGYQGIRKGDLVIHQMDAFAGSVGVSDSDGKGTPVYSVCEPATYASAQYYALVIREMARNQWILALAKGIRERSTDFRYSTLAAEPLPVPPSEEQDAIVRYLDDADQRIRDYVSAKERLIELLEEERQAIIHQAVTRGLDSNVKLKPSGVEWLGDVPEHWEVTRLKKVATIQAGLTLGKVYRSAELVERPYLRVANVQSGHLDLSEITTVQVPLAEVKKTTLEIGDVLMTEGGDIDKLGRGCMWRGEIPGCLHQNHVFAVRPNPTDLNPALLAALMRTVQGRNYFYATAKQTTNLAATNRTTLGEFPMCLPSIREQQAIVEHVIKETSTRDAAIDRARRQIELMEEYRTRLIADVVTGKIDVREEISQTVVKNKNASIG